MGSETSRLRAVTLLLLGCLPLAYCALAPVASVGEGGLVTWLRGLAYQGGSCLLDFLGVDHLLVGRVIVVPGRRVLLEQAGGGVRLLCGLVAGVAAWAVWQRRPLVHSLLLMAAAGLWAAAAGSLHVVILVAGLLRARVDLGGGYADGMVGAGLSGLAVWMTWCSDRGFLFLLLPVPKTAEEEWACGVLVEEGVARPARGA